MQTAIELINIKKVYGDYAAISDLSLSIKQGDFITVIGPSGCGKTTLLNIVGQLEPPTEGQVTYKITKSKEYPQAEARARSVFQEYGLFPWHSCIENVLLGMETLNFTPDEKKQKALDWLNTVGLGGHEHKYPKELSGGMKQRAAIAQALAAESQVILMDEPFGALDSLMRESLQDLVMEIWKKYKKTILFVTHNLREAIYLGNKVLVLGDRAEIILFRETPQVTSRVDSSFIEIEKEIRSLLHANGRGNEAND